MNNRKKSKLSAKEILIRNRERKRLQKNETSRKSYGKLYKNKESETKTYSQTINARKKREQREKSKKINERKLKNKMNVRKHRGKKNVELSSMSLVVPEGSNVFKNRMEKARALRKFKEGLPKSPSKRCAVISTYLARRSPRSPTIANLKHSVSPVEMAVVADIQEIIKSTKLKRSKNARSVMNSVTASISGENLANSRADSSESEECDSATKLDRGTNHNTLNLGWYRMKHHELLNEDDIPGSCAFIPSPIWAKGSFPVNEGDERTLDGCVYSERNACEKIYSIKVHNCGEHNVYYLNATATTGEAYCFKKDDDDDDDDDCEEQKEDYGKKFHRCHRNNRYVVLVIGSVIIAGVLISMVAIYLWRRKRLAAMLKKEMYKAPQDSNGPVVVTTNDNLPPKKY